MATIEDLLNALNAPINEVKLSTSEIWNMIINGDSLEKMGFSDEVEKGEWILDNPYDNI